MAVVSYKVPSIYGHRIIESKHIIQGAEQMIILDRYEDGYAVLEVDNQTINIDRNLLEENLKEGDVLVLRQGKYYKDEEATESRRRYMVDRFGKLWED